jgi:glycosyltransferase involved in cell wall biosynthesis
MRIGIDARELCGRATGVGRYLSGLLTAWSADQGTRRHDFVLYTPESFNVRLDARRFPTRLVSGSPGTWWEQVRLPRIAAADHLDVFFAPGYTAPLSMRAPTVVTIHDVSYVAHPEWFRLRDGIRRRWLTRAAARSARAIVTVSEFSKREILEHLGVADRKIHVVPQGIDAPARSTAAATDPRILYVGSIFNRRRVPDLIRAVAALALERPGVSLDLVGDNRTFPHEDIERTIASHQVGDRVRWHRYVTDDELRHLYARARAFAFLSEYEGLGMTPLEALAAGVPPVVLDTVVARETLRDAAIYVPANDIRAVTRALERALFDEPARAHILAAAPATLAHYRWPRAARETLAVIEAAALSG